MTTPPENDEQYKDVYAYAGLALYWAQCFEMSLTNALLLYERATNKKVTLLELEALEDNLRKKTLGSLLKSAKKVVAFDPHTEEHIDSALEKRNFLAHNFFQHYAIQFITPSGREEMIGKLLELQRVFQVADTTAMALCGALCKALGITQEYLNDEHKKLVEAATKG